MGKIDTITKDYMRNSSVFAGAFNYFIYGGEQVRQTALRHREARDWKGHETGDSFPGSIGGSVDAGDNAGHPV